MDEILATFRPDLFAGKTRARLGRHERHRPRHGAGFRAPRRRGDRDRHLGGASSTRRAPTPRNKGIRFAAARRARPQGDRRLRRRVAGARRADQRRRHRQARDGIRGGRLPRRHGRQSQQRDASCRWRRARCSPSRRASIINIASMLSYLVDDSVPAYCASQDRHSGADASARPSLRARGHPRQRDRARLPQDRHDHSRSGPIPCPPPRSPRKTAV